MSRSRFVLAAATCAAAAVTSSAGVARAAFIAGDSFVTTATGGAYVAGANLSTGATLTSNQPAANVSPNSAGYASQWGANNTGLIVPSTTGLNAAAQTGEVGGSILLDVRNNLGESRQVGRQIASYAPAGTYYFSGLLQASAVLGTGQQGYLEFSNRTFPSANAGFTAAARGFQIGFNGPSLIARARDAAGTLTDFTVAGSYAAGTPLFVVAKLVVNASGTDDALTVYLNPTDVSSEAQAAATGTTQTFTTDALATTADINKTAFEVFSVNNTGITQKSVLADEVHFGTTFADTIGTIVPEPGSAGLLAACGAGLLARRGRRLPRRRPVR
jgi:hypothetical protein